MARGDVVVSILYLELSSINSTMFVFSTTTVVSINTCTDCTYYAVLLSRLFTCCLQSVGCGGLRGRGSRGRTERKALLQ